jgi:hypothetical protein
VTPPVRRGLAVLLGVLFAGLAMSSFLAINGFTIWEWKRYGVPYLVLYILDGALTFPAHLAAGFKGGGSGGGRDGVAVRVYSIIASALFWGAGAWLHSFLRERRPAWSRAVLAVLLLAAVWSLYAGVHSWRVPVDGSW